MTNKPDSHQQRKQPVVGVGCVVFKGSDVLLIKRGKAPLEGAWSLPGGRLEWGETLEDGARRELLEETGLSVADLTILGVVDSLDDTKGAAETSYHYALINFFGQIDEGKPVAGDDAAEAKFWPLKEALTMPRWDKTIEMIKLAAYELGLLSDEDFDDEL